ncbi:palmitoyltransferase ZDHHC6-like [Onthophagus taurus]|uniref:palmitoyltransferase ZDHHC6-like n=1 Tax=Onthophagus taurus TaxID=166361 RepID=UPI000C20C9D9|nr:palmitoyltransferase ZDHHC6-like [Onthophagus taurus]
MCFGPLAKVRHWGPLTALCIIKCVTGVTIHCSNIWWPSSSFGGLLNTICFMSLSGLTLYNFLSAIFHGPGFLPLKWKPENEENTAFLQFCNVCNGYKAPRSHHCRKCKRCVLKMDHHCPWINTCVGWGNHAHFALFLAFAVLGCFHASIILSCTLYRAFYRSWYIYHGITGQPIVVLGLYGIVISVFALGLALGVVIAVGILFFFQARAIARNRTGIEDWIIEKANHRRKGTNEVFDFPYDLGVSNNIKQVINWQAVPVGDGINWSVKDGCDEFALTKEQIEQKLSKRQRTRLYLIIRASSGSWLPITQGFGVCLHPPCTDEPRLKLSIGDKLLVTRWRKYWLFGEKIEIIDNPQEPSKKGWFPRICAEESAMDDGFDINKKFH